MSGLLARLRAGKRWQLALALLLAGVMGALLLPMLPMLRHFSPVIVAAAALVGYLSRGRWTDAAVMAALHWVAGWPEDPAGTQLMACVTLPVLAFTARPLFSAFLGATVYGLVVGGGYLKEQFGGSFLTWQDLRYFFREFNDNIAVAATQPTLLVYIAAVVATIAIGGVLMWKVDGRFALRQARPMPRWPVAVLALLITAWSAELLSDHGQLALRRGVWTWSERWRDRPVSTFVSTMRIQAEATAPRTDARWLHELAGRQKGEAAPAGRPADIVVFLQESQFNPMSIAGCPAALCAMKAFSATPRTTAHGPMRVHLHGGGTWLSEFALSTGVPHTLFGAGGDFAPFNVAPAVRRSFVRSLRAAGYRTVAVYPVLGNMMNARQAYAAYGFDRFYDSAELGMDGTFETSDQQVHDAALRVLREEQKHGRPVFLFALTIFNHAEHGVRMHRVPPPLLERAGASFADPAVARNVADFIWRSQLFEQAMERTAQQLLGGTRPAVLAWFGDHQPPFGNAPQLRQNMQHFGGADPGFPARFETWYHVAANVGAPRQASPRMMDIVFLPSLLAEAAGAPMDDWLVANRAVRERCAGLLAECKEAAVRDAYFSYLVHDLSSFRSP
ncbi:sulfatase-like hydrolase/transferase [Caenimonas sedimenti]|uniref:Sulfatase-like hydrolase/transferase n=1 Tax=Caenimonas sedimenti TaxID=2596921 RepID=A0A562ZND0_9BURK|nr:sulfatase-like hydrolase/transferase [Caenimonas sedimenti]TWO69654.1 sulfatase-like hydrolase/transferase [Caenimonas sedimenti]